MPNPIPLLLIPGMLCDAAVWQNQINHLKNIADCAVTNITKHNHIATIANDVLANAPPQFALAGLSMGGYVSLEIMRQAPGRVLKLAIFDSSARADTPAQQEQRRLLSALAYTGQFKGVTPRLLARLIHPTRLGDKTLTDTITRMTERVGREAFVNQQTATLNRIDSRPFLPAISCPTVIVCGREDATLPLALSQEIADGIPGSRLEIIEKCGHLSPLEQPEAVNALMRRWLNS
ncbi:MAG: alpha/beta fold hydrolase [Alphaproteobacteria bacterium]